VNGKDPQHVQAARRAGQLPTGRASSCPGNASPKMAASCERDRSRTLNRTAEVARTSRGAPGSSAEALVQSSRFKGRSRVCGAGRSDDQENCNSNFTAESSACGRFAPPGKKT
jgi:hypothetical protein